MALNKVPVNMMKRMAERPDFIDMLGNSRGDKGRKIAELAESLKLMDNTKCLIYDTNEFIKEFGTKPSSTYKETKIGLKWKMKKFNLKPKIECNEGKVYVWINK